MVKTGKEYFQGSAKNKAFIKINRSDVMLAARGFDANNIDPRKAERTITELIYLFNQGETFTEDEVIQLFFAITKLFRCPSAELRRMVYQMIKEMRAQSSIYIVTQCLVKDIQDKNDFFRINALRTIHLVLDSSNLPQVERYIKTLITDKNAGVACAALLCGTQLFGGHEEMVRKWVGEVAEKLSPREPRTQLSALVLMNSVKRKDAVGFKKTLTAMMSDNLPEMAAIQLLRFLKEHIEDVENASAESAQITNFLLKQVRRSEVGVSLEAAKLACESSLLPNKELLDIIKILDSSLVSSNTVRRFSVLKLYNRLLKNPSRRSLMMNISEIERVLSDKNKSLSALAASILLRMCTESQLEKLLSQVSESMGEMSDDYKVDVLGSVKNVIKQYPSKYRLVNQFLLRFIEGETKPQFLRTTLEVMEFEIKSIGGEAKRDCLRLMAQFLMKPHFQKVHFQILGIISREVTSDDLEADFLKHLIAQIYLQSGAVRACSLSTLQKLSNYPSSKQNLLRRIVEEFRNDEDEEVRYRSIPKKSPEPYSQYELNMLETYLLSNLAQIQGSSDTKMLDWENVKEWGQNKGVKLLETQNTRTQFEKKAEEEEDETEDESRLGGIIDSHPTFSKYGKLLKVCRPVTLTENDSEFEVRMRKLFFQEHLILEFSVTNRIPDTVLEEARVELKHDNERLKLMHIIPAKEIRHNETSDIFLGLQVQEPEDEEEESRFYATATLSSLLKYKVKELKGGKVVSTYEDDYPLEDNELVFSDFMSPLHLPKGSFQESWDKFGAKEQTIGFGLPYPNTQAAIKELTKHFGMAVVDSGSEDAGKKVNAQVLQLSGCYLRRSKILLQCTVGFNTQSGCLLQLKIKSEDPELSLSVMNSIA